MAYSRTRDSRGLNIPEYQMGSAQNVKYETVIIPSTSQVAFGGYSIFDFKEKSCLINEVILQFKVNTLDGGPEEYYYPNFTPAFHWFSRIEVVQNNQILDTIYPHSNFLQHQLFVTDEERKKINEGAGDFLQTKSCWLKTKNRDEFWYVPLWSYFRAGRIPCLYPKDDLQIRLYMANLTDCITTHHNLGKYPNGVYTPPSASISCNLIVNLTRLGQDLNLFRLQSLNKAPEHYKFLEMRYGTTSIPVNDNAKPQFNYVLNSVTGNVVYFLAIVRQPLSSNKLLQERGFTLQPFRYTPILNFSLLDSTSTNISGGQPIPLSLVQHYLSRKWTNSSHYEDIGEDTIWRSNAIMYSFANDPSSAANYGISSGSFKFQGSEQLQIQFASPITQGLTLDIYAFCEACLEITPTYVKKITL
jgi:hypothetical protein